jgi:protein tyrosine/serine phosphatase
LAGGDEEKREPERAGEWEPGAEVAVEDLYVTRSPGRFDPSRRQARRRRRRRILLVLILAGAAIAGIKYGRHHVLPKRFAEVEAGQLYRSGYCEPWPLERVIERHGLRTILTLMSDEPESSEQQKEDAVALRHGVQIVRIGMPGDGRAEFELLDLAADTMADESKHPMLVHCSAGVNRTGAAYAAYRMKHCGWTFEEALAEAQKYGYSPGRTPQLRTHLQGYYQSRIVATQPASAR